MKKLKEIFAGIKTNWAYVFGGFWAGAFCCLIVPPILGAIFG